MPTPEELSRQNIDTQLHHRRSMRLKGYDYSLPGAYFVTLCAWQRDCLFGEVVGGEVRLSVLGQIVHDEWMRLVERFHQAGFPTFVIMPNHMHGIIVLHEHCRGAGFYKGNGFGGQTLRPYDGEEGRDAGVGEGVRFGGRPLRLYDGPHVAPGSLGAIVRAYKASVTWRIHAADNYSRAPVWQRNYYEHIIRSEKELENIWRYIEHNPQQWEQDQLHPAASPNRFNQDKQPG